MRTDFCLLDHLAAMRVSYKTIKNNNNVSSFFNVTVSQGHERTLTLMVKSRAWSSQCCSVRGLLWCEGWGGKNAWHISIVLLEA